MEYTPNLQKILRASSDKVNEVHVPVTHDHRVASPLVPQNVSDDLWVLGNVSAVYAIIPADCSECGTLESDSSTYAVMNDHGCACFCASMNGIRYISLSARSDMMES